MRRVGVLSLLAFSILLGTWQSTAKAADDRPIVVVFSVDGGRSGLSARFLSNLADYLASKLTESGKYTVVPRDQIKKRLSREKRKTHKECFEQSCQIELGKELAAEKTMSTRVMKMGRRCTLTLTLYDLRRATTEVAATKHGPCGENGVIDTVDGAVAKLLGNELEVKTAKAETARKKAEDAAALAAKRERSKQLVAVYKAATVKTGSAQERLEVWEAFEQAYPTDNPYLKPTQRLIASLRQQVAMEARAEEARSRKIAQKNAAKTDKPRSGPLGVNLLMLNEGDSDIDGRYQDPNGTLLYGKIHIGQEKDRKKKMDLRLRQASGYMSAARSVQYALLEQYGDLTNLYFVEDIPKNKNRKRRKLALLSDEKQKKAIEQYELLAKDKTYAQADAVMLQLGLLYDARGEVRKGLKLLHQLTKNYPQSKHVPLAYLAIAENAFHKTKNLENAKLLYSKVTQFPCMTPSERHFPNTGKRQFPISDARLFAFYKLAWCEYQLGDKAAAAREMRKAIQAIKGRKGDKVPPALKKTLLKKAVKDLFWMSR